MQKYQGQTHSQGQKDENPSAHNQHHERLQWALLIILSLLTVLALALPIIAYSLTGNWITLTPAASSLPLGYVWTWIAKRIFPLNLQDHERALQALRNRRMKTPL